MSHKQAGVGEDVEGLEPSNIAHENTEGAPRWEHLGALHMPPGVPLLGIHPKKEKGLSDDLCSVIHNSQNVKATQGSEDRWAGQQNVAHPFRGALFPRELKAGPTPASWKSLEDVIMSEMSQRDRVWLHIQEGLEDPDSETESRVGGAGGWETAEQGGGVSWGQSFRSG